MTQCPPSIPGTGNRLVVNNYQACNLVSVEKRHGQDMSVYVYNATTHEMVGAYYRTDTNRFACGSANVIALEAGVFPAAGCAADGGLVSTTVCDSDGGFDADVTTDVPSSIDADATTPDTNPDVLSPDDAEAGTRSDADASHAVDGG